MAAHARKIEKPAYPQHEYADQHKLLAAKNEFATSKRRLRDAAELEPSGEVACRRIREFGWDMGAELRDEGKGWMAHVSREVFGISESCGWWILSGHATSLSTRTVDAIARNTGIPVRVFYDPEL